LNCSKAVWSLEKSVENVEGVSSSSQNSWKLLFRYWYVVA